MAAAVEREGVLQRVVVGDAALREVRGDAEAGDAAAEGQCRNGLTKVGDCIEWELKYFPSVTDAQFVCQCR